MSKTTFKFLLWILVLTLFGGGFLGTIYSIGSLITHFNTGADPAAALNIQPNVPLDWPVAVNWLPDDADTGREMEPFTRQAIEAAYVRAWLQQGFSYTKGEPHGLKTYFTGPALAMVEDNINHVAAQELKVAQVASAHTLQLHYYSADGTIVAFTDREARVAQHITDANGNEIMAEEDLAAYQVVMMVDEGNWKVRHWLRRDINAYGTDRPVTPAVTAPTEEIVRLENGQLMLGAEPYKIRGFNYYPQENSWTDMWENYEGDTISQDLGMIAGMGMNTIRIFVPYELFGVDEVLNEAPDYTQRLRDFLNEAYRYDIRVVVTLYDFKSDYNVLTWPKADRHMEELMTTFNRHPAILAWDLKNEPDLDYDTAGEELVNIWLKHILDQARIYAPHHLITIGWAKAEHADELAAELDFVSFHYYAPTSQFLETLDNLQTKVGAEKPLMLGEFGLPTWNPRLFPGGHSEADQYNYYREILLQLQNSATAGYLAWTLYDFPHVPAQVAGRLPWKRYPQREMGIIRTDGTEKPAAALFHPNVSQEQLQTSLENSGIKPFYQTAFAAMILTMLTLMFLIWRAWLHMVHRSAEKHAEANGQVTPPIKKVSGVRLFLQKSWRAQRARRLIKRRKRRDKKYGRWERRAERKKQRRARRRARWGRLAQSIPILRRKPVASNHDSADRLSQSATGIQKSMGEMKPLAKITTSADGLQEDHEQASSFLNKDQPPPPAGEAEQLTRQELISRLLQPHTGPPPTVTKKQSRHGSKPTQSTLPQITVTVTSSEPPDRKPILDDAEKPGDGVWLDTSGVPAEENEFAFDENILWSDLEPATLEPEPALPEEHSAGETPMPEDETDESGQQNDKGNGNGKKEERQEREEREEAADHPPENRSKPDDLDRFFTWEE